MSLSLGTFSVRKPTSVSLFITCRLNFTTKTNTIINNNHENVCARSYVGNDISRRRISTWLFFLPASMLCLHWEQTWRINDFLEGDDELILLWLYTHHHAWAIHTSMPFFHYILLLWYNIHFVLYKYSNFQNCLRGEFINFILMNI